MAITRDEVIGHLTARGLHVESGLQVSVSFPMSHYVGAGGERSLRVKIEISEGGEYLKVYAPGAFKADGEHAHAVLKACMILQWKTKLVQFEYHERDGEVRPVVEFPINDGTVTRSQLYRCVRGLARLVDEFHLPLKRALETGVIDLQRSTSPEQGDADRFEERVRSATPEERERILAILGLSVDSPTEI
jgi:hypothetical protein